MVEKRLALIFTGLMEFSYSFTYFWQVLKPLNQVLSTIADQEVGHQFDPDNINFEGNYPIEEFEVRIMEPDKSGGPWQTRASIPMQSSENALTVRVVTLLVSSFLFLFFFYLSFCFLTEKNYYYSKRREQFNN